MRIFVRMVGLTEPEAVPLASGHWSTPSAYGRQDIQGGQRNFLQVIQIIFSMPKIYV